MVCGGWRDFDSVSIGRLRGFAASLEQLDGSMRAPRHRRGNLDSLRTTSPSQLDWGERRQRNHFDGVALAFQRLGSVGEAPPRWQDHEQGFEECAPIAGSVFRQGGGSLAVGVAIVVKQLSRETKRLLRGDASVPRSHRAREY